MSMDAAPTACAPGELSCAPRTMLAEACVVLTGSRSIQRSRCVREDDRQ